MDTMPYAGRSETSPLDPEAFVTDSAAGGTAIATGVKTFNGAVGIDADENPVPSVLERAREAGKATGLVSNSQVTDATPASFGAHIADSGFSGFSPTRKCSSKPPRARGRSTTPPSRFPR